MKKIGFIGAFDKTDLMLFVAKLLITLNKKVLMIDSTIIGKARYIVPVINEEDSYITTFEDIDIAVGFDGIDKIGEKLQEYDIVLVDADTQKLFKEFELISADHNFFVSSFDMYSLMKGMDILNETDIPILVTKILYIIDSIKEEDEYLSFLSSKAYIKWDYEKIFFEFNKNDLMVIHENQRTYKIKMQNLSNDYKEAIVVIVHKILDNVSENEIKKVLKNVERGV